MSANLSQSAKKARKWKEKEKRAPGFIESLFCLLCLISLTSVLIVIISCHHLGLDLVCSFYFLNFWFVTLKKNCIMPNYLLNICPKKHRWMWSLPLIKVSSLFKRWWPLHKTTFNKMPNCEVHSQWIHLLYNSNT